jgi:hypothetical protein
MTKKHLPTVEQIEEVEDILDEVEGFWQDVSKMLRVYPAKDGGAFFVHPKNLANFLAENPSAKPLQLPRLDRRMLHLVKMIFDGIEDAKSGHRDEVAMFLAESAATENPSKERIKKAAVMAARGDLAVYDKGDGLLCMIRDEDVEDFEHDHPEAKRITSPEHVEEFLKKQRVS